MTDQEQRKQNIKLSLTGAGVAAIIASILPVVVLFRGEPTAEKVAKRGDQENQRLFRYQRKMHQRLALAEAKLELFEKICVKALQPRSVASVAAPPTKVAKVRCRRGWVQEGIKCVKLQTALDMRARALAAAERDTKQALAKAKRALYEKRHAAKVAKMKQQTRDLPAPPKRLLPKK